MPSSGKKKQKTFSLVTARISSVICLFTHENNVSRGRKTWHSSLWYFHSKSRSCSQKQRYRWLHWKQGWDKRLGLLEIVGCNIFWERCECGGIILHVHPDCHLYVANMSSLQPISYAKTSYKDLKRLPDAGNG